MSEPNSAVESPSGDELLAELTEDFLCRYRAGERPSMDEYASKYPELAVRIRDVFAAVVMMEQPGVDGTVDFAPAADREGAIIGRYKLLERIGEGGFGVVYMAEQQHPIRRKVAIKVIKPGIDTRQVIARFEAERQALAMMDHENIAKVLDAGATDSGRPYFVMELVHGMPITEFCDRNELSPRERLELFVQVCRAVQHAHTKGIIHRDIKPTNVLVSRGGDHFGVPVPKVIDFGVAKATDQQLTDRTLVTNLAQMVGTPPYMSPEQAEMTNIDIDTRSDVYSLGVLLYELLTGTTPLDKDRLKQAAFDEVRRIIREEEPPRPSTRLRTMGEAARSISARRKSDPKQLGQFVRGDLDWIVMKALEKERSRRYDTAIGLAQDIERYLRGEAVEACAQSALYRLKKFARRNKGPVAAAGVVLLTLVGGIVGTTFGLVRAEHARRAEAERAKGELRAKEEVQKRLTQIEKGTEMLAAVFRDLDPNADETQGMNLRELLGWRLADAAQQLDGDAVGDPLVVARLQHVLGTSLRELGHLQEAEGLLDKAYQTRERLLGAEHLDTAASKHDLATLYRDQANYAPAEELYKEVLAVRTAKLGGEHPDTLTTQHHLAILYQYQDKDAMAESLCKAVLASRTRTLGADHPDTLTSKHRLASMYRNEGKFELAEALYNEVLSVRTAKLGADHLATVATKHMLATLYELQEKFDRAEAIEREVLAVRLSKLGADHPDTLASQNLLASLHVALGEPDLAELLYQEVVARRSANLGSNHPNTLNSQCELAGVYTLQGKYALAESLYQEVLAIRTATLGAHHRETIFAQDYLAALYRSMKRLDESISILEKTFQLRRTQLRSDHPEILGRQVSLGAIYCEAGRLAEGIPLIEEVRNKGSNDPHPAWVRTELLTAYIKAGKTKEATALVMERVQEARSGLPAGSPELAAALVENGKLLIDATAYAAAEPLLLNGYKVLTQTEALNQPQVKDARQKDTLKQIVQLYDAWGKPDEAAQWRQELAAVSIP